MNLDDMVDGISIFPKFFSNIIVTSGDYIYLQYRQGINDFGDDTSGDKPVIFEYYNGIYGGMFEPNRDIEYIDTARRELMEEVCGVEEEQKDFSKAKITTDSGTIININGNEIPINFCGLYLLSLHKHPNYFYESKQVHDNADGLRSKCDYFLNHIFHVDLTKILCERGFKSHEGQNLQVKKSKLYNELKKNDGLLNGVPFMAQYDKVLRHSILGEAETELPWTDSDDPVGFLNYLKEKGITITNRGDMDTLFEDYGISQV